MKTIPLPDGLVTLVDDEDYPALNAFTWNVLRWKHLRYAFRGVTRGGQRKILMHRQILTTPPGMDTDHINGDGLDNRRCNLRVATHSQNMANWRTRRPGRSGFFGVSWDIAGKKWRARVGGTPEIWVGLFESAEEAARARDRVAVQTYGPFARLNFATGECVPGVELVRGERLAIT